jgi:hypothetical protein
MDTAGIGGFLEMPLMDTAGIGGFFCRARLGRAAFANVASSSSSTNFNKANCSRTCEVSKLDEG